MNKTKTLAISLVALATIKVSAHLILVHASDVQSQRTVTTVEEGYTAYISNTEILNQRKTINSTAYASIPANVLAVAYHQDLLRQGTTKNVKTKKVSNYI